MTAASAHDVPGSGDRSVEATLIDLRRARRKQRTTDFDVAEAFYRVYISGILAGIAIWLLSGVVGDSRVGAHAASQVASRGPQILGMVLAVGFAVALRSGGRGGPLVLEAADVRHVLLSPVPRVVALRRPALRQLRFGASVGAGAGAVAGLLAFRRLPGNVLAWLACGAGVGALAVAAGLGLAMLASGRRMPRWMAVGAGVLVAGWSLVDLVDHVTTSPATFLAEVALWPLTFRLAGLVGVAVAAVAAVAGPGLIAGVSIEAAERRATLVGQIRFAATLQDLRTVVVLRRQLSQELPRQKPWVRLPRTVAFPFPAGAGAGRRRRMPVWRRSWHGIARFPGIRFARMAVLGGVAGACAVGVYRGTTPLLLVGGLALYVAALDATEPLAQEIDHPDRWDAYVGDRSELLLRLAGPPIVLMVLVALVGVAVAAVVAGSTTAVAIGLVTAVPAALAAVAGAMVSVVQGAPAPLSSSTSMLPPEATGVRVILRIAIPPAVAIAGLIPVLATRHPAAGVSRVAAAANLLGPVVLVALAVGLYVRYRDRARSWWSTAMEEAGGRRPPARPAA